LQGNRALGGGKKKKVARGGKVVMNLTQGCKWGKDNPKKFTHPNRKKWEKTNHDEKKPGMKLKKINERTTPKGGNAKTQPGGGSYV